MSSDFEQLGGTEGLRAIIADFIDRVFDDFIIGFLFVGKDREQLIQREFEFAASHLGGRTAYSGRPLGKVHQPLRINEGHFRRRLAILRTVLNERQVPQEVIERWIVHDQKLLTLITNGEDCVDGRTSNT